MVEALLILDAVGLAGELLTAADETIGEVTAGVGTTVMVSKMGNGATVSLI